jgi:hypothetical protein
VAGPCLVMLADQIGEIRLGQLRDAVVEPAQGGEVRAGIGLGVDVVEGGFSGDVEWHAPYSSGSGRPVSRAGGHPAPRGPQP